MITPTAIEGSGDGVADALVVFGATGDLARKKLHPALYHLASRGRLGVPVLGVARSAWDDERFRTFARDAVTKRLGGASERELEAYAERLSYVSGDYADAATYERLRERLESVRHPAFYLAIPPSMFERVISGLMKAGLHQGARRRREALRARPHLGT